MLSCFFELPCDIYMASTDFPFWLFCRGVYPHAEEYLNYADKSHMTLVEAFRNMQLEEEEPLENGDASYEVHAEMQYFVSAANTFRLEKFASCSLDILPLYLE